MSGEDREQGKAAIGGPLLVDDPRTTLLTAEEAAAAAHVPASTIRTWASRGRLTPYGTNPVRYLEIEVLTVERDTRRGARLSRLLAEAAEFEP